MVDGPETLGGALEDVRAFCAVMEFGSISAAARELGETKGSISRRISRLERRLGSALLARTPRAVNPTEEGTAFHAKAREALSLLADAAEGARQARSVPQGHLRVTAPVDIGMEVLPPLIVRFRRRHPQITVELLPTDAPLDLAANRIDVALRATPGGLPDMGYRASTVAAFHILTYASPDYLARRGTPRAPIELEAHELAIGRESDGPARLRLTHRRGRAVEVPFPNATRTTDYASVLRLVTAGGGIGPIPDIIAANALAEGSLVRVLPDWRVADATLYAITLSGLEAPARVRVFREFIREELAAAR